MKIVIVGAGKVGSVLTEQLVAENHDVTVIDTNPALVDRIVNVHDVMGCPGNGANYDVQKEAGVASAQLLVACTCTDEINIIACLVAKKLGVEHTIARVRNPEYGKQLRFMRAELGLTMTINPEKEAAREIARILRFPTAAKVEAFSKGRLELIEHRLTDDSKLCGMALSELNRTFRSRVLICAVARKDEVFIPSGDFALQAGDVVYLTASPYDLESFFRALGIFKSRANSAIVVGASRTGYYLTSLLLDAGLSVKLIDEDPARTQSFSERLPRALIITGDPTDAELLREEGIEDTDAFVAVTGIDEANILMAINVARKVGCKVVAKVNHRTLQDLVAETGMLESTISPSDVTSDRILRYVRSMQNADGLPVKTLHRLVSGKVDALEFTVTAASGMVEIPLKELPIRPGILIAGIVRQNGEILIPAGEDCLRDGDDVILVTTDFRLRDLRDILR